MPPVRVRFLAPLLALLALAVAGGLLLTRDSSDRGEQLASACASGTNGDADRERAKGDADRERAGGEAGRERSSAPVNGMFDGPGEADRGGEACDRPGHPESFADLARANSSLLSRSVAPGTRLRPGAYRAAVAHRAALPTTGESWKAYGDTPLTGNDQAYDQSNGSTRQGLPGLSGRATAFARDPSGNIYVAASNGGVWKSSDGAGTWTSIGDGLPTQVVAGVDYSPAGGGTLVVLTGDNAFGGDTYAGLGAYYTRDGGATWTHSTGIPDGVLGFKIAVDPTDPQKVYAATGGGLYRSTDGGASYTNVNLPTGACAGKPVSAKDCFLANVVTDVVVQGPGNAKTSGGQPGAVMASVGWRAGNKKNADGSAQSPGNGIYVSPSGAPGSFKNMDLAGHSAPVPPFGTDPLTQARIGRIALGIANGPAQDHRIVYAIVQDAVKFNGGATGLDVDEPGTTSAAQSDFLNGVWVSTDFGASWKQLEGSTVIDNDTTSNSALSPPVCKAPAVISYCPGVQAWYNLWVQPDPTQATSAGVPTRLLFGLEEVWSNIAAITPPTGLDGSSSTKFQVVGRYYANEACTLLNATNGLPICPVAQGGQSPKTTTHPDQHGAIFVPDGKGGVTALVANDGGVFKQHVDGPGDFSNAAWGDGANLGLHTLQPYDAEMAKDGTVYMGLQDNGEAKIDPSGKSYTVFGGDGGFTAVEPDNSQHAYEEYVYGDIAVTKDGGKNWTDIQPSFTSAQFTTPFQMDPADAKHLMIGGREVYETTAGTDSTSSSWAKSYDLGTRKHPGDASASASGDDADNTTSALDVLGLSASTPAPTGPHTPDFGYSGGTTTVPGLGDQTGTDTFLPGSYEDHPFTVKPGEGDASATIALSWSQADFDWDLYVYRKAADGTLTRIGESATSNPSEKLVIPAPGAGDYVIRVVNFAAAGSYSVKATFAQRTDPNQKVNAAYVGFCGFCDVITQGLPFANGVATNVGGDKTGAAGSPDGWHVAKAQGLPSRYITSIRMDPANAGTVYATLAGYGRRWAAPGALGDDTSKVGVGHVFKSTDAGATFTDISGDLPDVPANWSVLHDGHLVVGTDIGVFASCNTSGGAYSVLGKGLPAAPISTLRFKPGDPDLLVAATYGRGVYTYRFTGSGPACPRAVPGASASSAGAPVACASRSSFTRAAVRPQRHGLRFSGATRDRSRYQVDLFQQSSGRRVVGQRLIQRWSGRSGAFSWAGLRDRRHHSLRDGYYFARFTTRRGKTVTDVRRITLERTHGRFAVRKDFYMRPACGLLRSFKLSGPTFGGARKAKLGVAFVSAHTAKAVVVIQRGKKMMRLATLKTRKGKETRLHLKVSRAIAAGEYRVSVAVTDGTRREAQTLYARRI